MRLFLDCEWNSYGGELISIALVPDLGWTEMPFYCVLPIVGEVDEWVAKNVMPLLLASPQSLVSAQNKLQRFLSQWEAVTIVADWPEDIARLCNFMVTGPGKRIKPLPVISFELDFAAGNRAVSRYPHNALSDAQALRDAYYAVEEAA